MPGPVGLPGVDSCRVARHLIGPPAIGCRGIGFSEIGAGAIGHHPVHAAVVAGGRVAETIETRAIDDTTIGWTGVGRRVDPHANLIAGLTPEAARAIRVLLAVDCGRRAAGKEQPPRDNRQGAQRASASQGAAGC